MFGPAGFMQAPKQPAKEPLIHCAKCEWQGVENELTPIRNPRVKRRTMYGCPKCGDKGFYFLDKMMNLELDAEQAQAVINSQSAQIGKMKRRLRRGHVHTKYLANTKMKIPQIMIQAAMDHIAGLINCDQPDGPEDWGFSYRYDHEVLEKMIEIYRGILQGATHDPVTLPLFSFEYLYATNGHDEVAARNTMYTFGHLQGELKLPSEPDTPNYFSSDDEKNGL